MDIENYFSSRTRKDYQRDNFDDFLSKVKFSYNIPSIHIAGTNGKGSTLNYIKGIYIAAGYKVGTFSSPDSLNESIKINDQPIENEYVEKIINEYDKYFKKYDLSGFEIQTFIAFNYFIDNKVDIAVIECGMGGELDATNIFTPILSIITSVSIEHSDFLGVSLSEISLHKAGIIKENAPCLISSHLNEEVMTVIIDKTRKEDSKLYVVDEYHNKKIINNQQVFDYRPYANIKINSLATYEIEAACLAIEASKILNDYFPVNENSVRDGLLIKTPKCRFEIVGNEPIIVLDGAHNPEAISRLRNEMDTIFFQKKVEIVFACFRDKNIAFMLPELSLLGNIHITTFNHPRARNEDDYFIYLSDYDYSKDYKDLINKLKEDKDNVILVTGSLAFAFEVRDYLNGK